MAKLKEILGDLALLGCGMALLGIFISILITGGYEAGESNPYILWGEIIFFSLIVLLGIERFIKDVQK